MGSNPIGDADSTVRKPAKRPSSNLGERLWVRLPSVLFKAQWTSGCGCHVLTVEIAGSNPAWVTYARVGVHWRAKLAVTRRSSDCGGSTPSRPTCWPVGLLARSSVFHAEEAGFDSRTGCCMDQVVEPADTRRLERRALGHGSSTLPLVTIDCRWAGAQLAFMRPACPDRYRDLQLRVGQCSVELHKLRPPGATPGLATAEYANWQSDEVESLVNLQVRILPRSLRSRGPAAKTPG